MLQDNQKLSISADPAITLASDDAQTIGVTNTVYSDPTTPADESSTLRVAHEVSKDGNIVNTAIIRRMVKPDPLNGEDRILQVTFKITYDNRVYTKAQVIAAAIKHGLYVAGDSTKHLAVLGGPLMRADGEYYLSTMNFDKLLNLEH